VRKASTTRGSSRWREFRRRGGGWVVAQLILLVLLAAALFVGPRWPDQVRMPFAVAGALVAVAGVVLGAWALHALGRGFTPFPEPRRGSSFVAHGPYRLARHPMYGGALLLLAGLSLAHSVSSLVLTALLGVLWWRKSVDEERRLAAAYPGYADYRARTPHRFLPFAA
jgi:protein-S-isoprenylcysteine O-methyltransferase Ste14